MRDDAGFAVAFTIREQLLGDAFLVSYADGSFPRTLSTAAYGGIAGSPEANLDVFLGPPAVACHADGTMTVTLELWGLLDVTLSAVDESAQIAGRLAVDIGPEFIVETVVKQAADGTTSTVPYLALDPGRTTVTVSAATGWDFTVISSPGFSPQADSYLRSADFVGRLQQTLAGAVLLGKVSMPSIEVSFLGPIAGAVNVRAHSRVRPGAILVGLNIDSDPNNLIVGDADALTDFAQDNGLAAVTSARAVPALLQDVQTKLAAGVSASGATLNLPVSMTADLGRFRVSGSASNSEGTANFSFSIVPTLYASRPGKVFTDVRRPVHVNGRTWPALGFTAADVSVDVDASWWVDVLTGLGTLINPVVLFFVMGMLDSTGAEFKGQIESQAGDGFTPVPRVQRLPPSTPGGPTVRVELAAYEITPDGTYTGIKVTPEPLPGMLIGPVSVPSDYASSTLAYSVRLPMGVGADDPQLRIRWTVIDPATGNVLANDDGLAQGRDTYSVVPGTLLPGGSHLRVTVRVYRTLGPTITDLLNDGVTLAIGAPLTAGAFVRWRYQVKNPQVAYDASDQEWVLDADLRVNRHSRLHRTDSKRCAFADKRSRYADIPELLDTLPFPLEKVAVNRDQLCDYCFYGGPAGLRLAL